MNTLFLVGAVPFSLGPTTPQQGGLQGRRRHPAGPNLVLPTADSSMPSLHDILRDPEGANFVSHGLELAGRSLGGARQDAATNTPPRAPPNSPSAVAIANNSNHFVFPDVEDEGSSSSSSAEVTPSVDKTRNRKRRRVPSFRKHTVAKMAGPASDADDEEETGGVAVDDDANDSDAEARQELSLRLRILAESQKSKDTDWSKVGEELRAIADSFQEVTSEPSSRPRRPAAPAPETAGDVVPSDILSFINLLLPVSIPQSLWSAIASYVAWKILKRL